jgi:hypothetical protein
VLLVPEKYTPMQSVIFLYDGQPSSVYAVKMFCYDFSFVTTFIHESFIRKTIEAVAAFA